MNEEEDIERTIPKKETQIFISTLLFLILLILPLLSFHFIISTWKWIPFFSNNFTATGVCLSRNPVVSASVPGVFLFYLFIVCHTRWETTLSDTGNEWMRMMWSWFNRGRLFDGEDCLYQSFLLFCISFDCYNEKRCLIKIWTREADDE